MNWQRIEKNIVWLGLTFLAVLIIGMGVLFFGGTVAVPSSSPVAIPTAVLSPLPLIEQETSKTAASAVNIWLEPLALHGSPPYTAQFNATVSSTSAQPLTCRALYWDFGNGTGQPGDCAVVSGQGMTQLAIHHTYDQPGTYYAHLRLTLADDSFVESPTQTVVVADPQPESGGWLRWAVWLGTMMGITAVAFWLRRRPRKQQWAGYGALLLLLIAFVPPFSYLPDPLGLILGPTGLYRADPRLPFANEFVMVGDPTETLRPYLDALIGQTGLEPLDPTQPLARYDFVRVRSGRFYASVGVRMTYADSSQHTYDVPLYQPHSFFGFYQSGWRYDGLARLRAEHRAIGEIPLAGDNAPVRLETPQPVTAVMPSETPNHYANSAWFRANSVGAYSLSPLGDALLVTKFGRAEGLELWRVSLLGEEPVRVARDVDQASWSPDGRHIIYTSMQLEMGSDGSLWSPLYLADGDGSGSYRWGTVENRLPHIGENGVWYVADGRLWFLPYDADVPQLRTELPGTRRTENMIGVRDLVVSLSPDEQRIAYACNPVYTYGSPVYQLCLQNMDDRQSPVNHSLNASYMKMAWRTDGQQLAIIQWGYNQTPAALTLLERNGDILWQTQLADEGQAGTPQWLPDGSRLFVQMFPQDGRRILTINAATGEALDLSQPRWDAYFALFPDGESMLLGNGRGGLWHSQIELD